MKFGQILGVGMLALMPFATSCNLGPFPSFLESLDPLDPVEGHAKGWLLAQDDQTQILVLSEGGQFLRSIVNRNTYLVVETGEFRVAGNSIVFHYLREYDFPQETGVVKGREGAQSREIDREEVLEAELLDDWLSLKGVGNFISTKNYLSALDMEDVHDRGCMLLLVQLAIRTSQARIRNFGGGGTVIYHNNQSTFSGFLEGEKSILVENLLSPDTTITFSSFRDIPEVRLEGTFITHVDTAGDGSLDKSVTFQIGGVGDELLSAGGAGGTDSLGVDSTGAKSLPLTARGKLIYGPQDALRLERASVVGGSYDLELDYPLSSSDNFSWDFLEDLDLRGCYNPKEVSER